MTYATLQANSGVTEPHQSVYEPMIPVGTDADEAAKYQALRDAQGLGEEIIDYSDDLADAGLRPA